MILFFLLLHQVVVVAVDLLQHRHLPRQVIVGLVLLAVLAAVVAQEM
jgi:Flp pilus assembly protein protease CpaA